MFPLSRKLLAATTAVALCASPRAHAQATPDQAFAAATTIYDSGDYPAACAAYEKVLADYPTAANVPNVQVQLALAYSLNGDNAKCLEMLKKFSSGPPAAPALKEIADILEPQALSAQAAALPAEDAKRKTGYTESAKKFAEFIQKYPRSPSAEDAYYGLAVAKFQLGDFAAAKDALRKNIEVHKGSPSVADSSDLLALILASEANKTISDGGDRAAALALYDEAAGLLRDLAKNDGDPALANKARFQLGETLLAEAAAAPDDRKKALLAEARENFRAILPKSVAVARQQALVATIPDRRGKALTQGEAAQKRVEQEALRERRKLAELEALPDRTANAVQRIGDSYFQEGRYDEARVVLDHVKPALSDAPDKKRNLYETAMTYALQNAAAQASARYEDFQRQYRGDAVATALPFAMGNLYLTHPDPAVRDPQKAAKFFKEAVELYPNSPFLASSVVREATARAQQGDFDGALKTYRDFLATNPPAEAAADAQIGVANVLKDQRKLDEAIAAYKETLAKYPGSPRAVEAEFWAGQVAQQKGDNQAALPALQEFAQKHADSPLVPNALYFAAQAQLGLGRTDDAVATMAQLAEKFPDSQPAPFTYFQRAQIAGAAGKPDDLVSLMRQFAEKYPKDEKIFFAYDSIGQTENSRGNAPAAAQAYADFVAKYASSPKAPSAMVSMAAIRRAAAERLGRFGALGPDEQKAWKENMAASIAASEQMVSAYPDSAELGLGLRSLLAAKKLEADAALTDAAGVTKYFQALAESAPASAKSKILFTGASYIAETDAPRALQEMDKAYDPTQVYAPADLELYGLALLKAGQADKAKAVFEKIAADYPNPQGSDPSKAPMPVQEAQATALFGLGSVAQKQGDVAAAGQTFEKLKSLYPWSPKVLEANYGIAAAMRGKGQGDEALALLTQIIRAPNASSALRADSMLLGGYIQKDKGQREAAIDYFIKISAFYEGVPDAAATGLWEGGQLLEAQVAELQASNPAKAAEQKEKVLRAYKELAEKFPSSPLAAKARERLSALGAK